MIGFLHCIPYLLLQHAMRVLKILNVDDLIDGLVFCDYADPNFSSKPEREYFDQVWSFCAIGRACQVLMTL